MKNNFTLRLLILSVFISIVGISYSQSVSYKVIENKPYKTELSVGIVPLDLTMFGSNIIVGPGLDLKYRPLNFVNLSLGVANGLYMNPIDNKSLHTGLKKSGGILLDIGAEYVWFRKGRNFKDPSNENERMKYPLILKSSTSVSTTTTTSLLFPFNRSVERSIRGGYMINNLPWDEDDHEVSSVNGAFVGISKRTYKSAVVTAEGYGEKKRQEMYGYYFDIIFGSASYFDPLTPNLGGRSVRFGIEYKTVGGLMPVGILLEMGGLPYTGGYIRVKYIFALDFGKHYYEGDYKMRKKSKKKFRAILQALI